MELINLLEDFLGGKTTIFPEMKLYFFINEPFTKGCTLFAQNFLYFMYILIMMINTSIISTYTKNRLFDDFGRSLI